MSTDRLPRVLTNSDDRRHLLRRLAFAATPTLDASIAARPLDEAVESLLAGARRAPVPEPPPFVRAAWTNTALRMPGMSAADYQARRKVQQAQNQREIEALRDWWLREMMAGPSPLRENIVLFLHGTVGGSTGSADMPQAVHGTNALLRRSALGKVPDLLEQLALDPGVMVQIGIDELRHDRDPQGNILPHRAARAILDNWTVGPGAYSGGDAVALSRALTGWLLVAPPGQEPPAPDPTAFRSARRTGLIPVFDRGEFEGGPKTLLGTTQEFDAASAIRFLARHPLTARRYSARLIRYFGVADADGRLERQLVDQYRSTDGSLDALVRTIVVSQEFWSDESRWNLIKSPVHLAVGAVRQLGLSEVPMERISVWLTATGQKLFDTPNFGNAGWNGQDEWVVPSDRLARRYQLGVVLFGRSPRPRAEAGGAADAVQGPGRTSARLPMALDADASPARVMSVLDPAPGLDVARLAEQGAADPSETHAQATIRQVLSTPQYQLA